MTWDPQACPPPGEGGGGRGEGVPSAPDCVDQGMLTCASGGSIPTFVRGVLILSPGLQSPPLCISTQLLFGAAGPLLAGVLLEVR